AHGPRRRARADARRVRLHAPRRRLQGAPGRFLRLPGQGLGAQPQAARDAPLEAVHPMTTVTLYGRPGCHLCDEAREALHRVMQHAPFRIEEIDIETDDALHARYLEHIPVIAIGTEELFDYVVDEDALQRRILYREVR